MTPPSSRARGALLVAPAYLWFTVLLIAPLFVVLFMSFATRGTYGEVQWTFSWEGYTKVFAARSWPPLERSFVFAGLTTICCLILGFPHALCIALSGKHKNFLLTATLLPFWTNFLIRTYAWIMLLENDGLINRILQRIGAIDTPLNLVFTDSAVLIGLVYIYLPFMVLPLYAALERLDWQLVEAARDLGASDAAAFRRVVLPLAAGGMASGMIMVFVLAFGDFVTPDMLGGARHSMLGNLIRDQFLAARNWPFGAALSVVLVVAAAAGAGILALLRRRAFVPTHERKALPAGSGAGG